jgi:predicted ATP-grasp superfamily ATP-dependent carboligase
MNVIILGASTRAAAFSARRAGLRPWCVDLYGDADLECCFPVRKVPYRVYPHAMLTKLADAPDGPVIYTGGLENHPRLLGRIDRPLWGNGPDVLRRVRSPFLLADVLQRHGLPALAVRREPPSGGDRGQWLVKPRHGSGGVGIRRYADAIRFDPRTHYLQEYCPGIAFSGVFLGMQDGRSILLGLTRLLQADWLHAPGFHYCGNIGPLSIPPANLHDIGDVLAGAFALRGLFGVDMIYHSATSDFRVLEVNPRYTASIEVLERAHGHALLELHRAVFENRAVAGPLTGNQSMVGKAILYARDQLVFPSDGLWMQALAGGAGNPDFADIPHPGDVIERGMPVMTLFAAGATEADCLEALRRRAETLDRCLRGS